MIRVYVRSEEGGDGQLLGEFKPGQICKLVELFKCFLTYNDYSASEEHFVSAQFVSDETSAYFEIITTSALEE